MSLELEGVSHWYKGRSEPVLCNVSACFVDDESVALMGPSGSGKTTMLSILGLLMHPVEGKVRIDGIPVPTGGQALAALRSSTFAWVFQTVNAMVRRTAVDNAALALYARGQNVPEAQARAMSALEVLGLGSVAARSAHTLSGGELQRVCIARAIAAVPRFILADEPTAQLDSTSAAWAVDALIRHRPRGSTVIIATHDPDVASQCQRTIRLRDGRPEQLS